MLRNNAHKLITSGIFISLIVFIVANQSLYLHTHQLLDGTLITHAHPYNKSSENSQIPFSSHKHSTAQYLLISDLSLASIFVFFCIALFFQIVAKQKHTTQLTESIILIELYKYSSGRSPPLC